MKAKRIRARGSTTKILAAEAARATQALAKAVKALSDRCRADKGARAAIREARAALGNAVRDAEVVADSWDAIDAPGERVEAREVFRRLRARKATRGS